MAGSETKARSKSRVPLAWLARLWLVGIVLLLVVDWLTSGFRLNWLTRIYFWSTLLMSLICFAAYGIDKRRANLQKRRIPEKQLHLMEVLGGWPGAVLGQQMFRHKTIKMSFRLVLWAIIGLHVALSAYFVYDAFQEKQRRERILEDAQAAVFAPALKSEVSRGIIRYESTNLTRPAVSNRFQTTSQVRQPT